LAVEVALVEAIRDEQSLEALVFPSEVAIARADHHFEQPGLLFGTFRALVDDLEGAFRRHTVSFASEGNHFIFTIEAGQLQDVLAEDSLVYGDPSFREKTSWRHC